VDVLDVRTFPQARGLITRYVYLFESSDVDAAGSAIQEFSADVNQTVVNRFCAEIGDVVLQRSDGGRELQRIGRMLYHVLFPELQGPLPDLVRRVRSSQELFIRTNEATVPWEALFDDDQFFGLKYDLGRQYVVRKQVARGRVISPIKKVLLVADPAGDLPRAGEEVHLLAETLRERGAECKVLAVSQTTVTRVLRELGTGTYDLLHYSGHVVAVDGTQDAALVLHGDELLDRGTIEALLNGAAPPVVFINGCASAEPLSNLCSSFMATGSRVVIGTLHQVTDDVGLELSTRFYDQLINHHQTAGGALRAARHAVSESHGPAWASFVLYGNPMTHIGTTGGGAENGGADGQRPAAVVIPEAPAPVEQAVGTADAARDGEPRLDTAAEALLARAAEQASSRGVVTSLDLFLQLTQADEAMQAAIGAERLPMVQIVLGDLLHTVGGRASGEVIRSDTVTRVLVVACEIAARAGRLVAGVRDVSQAFVDVGGGTSSLLLAAIGIDLSRLDLSGAEPAAPEGAAGAAPAPAVASEPDATVPAEAAEDAPFDDGQRLMTNLFTPSALKALEAARDVAAAHGMLISSEAMFLGFGRAGSETLLSCLAHLGPAGQAMARSLQEGDSALRLALFSARSFTALQGAYAAAQREGKAAVDDRSVLCALLADPGSAVCERLRRSGVAPEDLLACLGTQP